MPLIQRFTTVARGAMVLTGNALSIRTGTPFPDLYNDLISGSYISTNTSLVADIGFPNGTTFLQPQSSSSAVLSIPPGSTVLYAQIFWTINFLSPNVDSSINLTKPDNSTVAIAPDLGMKQGEGVLGLVHQAQVITDIISAAGSGTYTVSNVPGDTIQDLNSYVPNAWYLLVVYKNNSMPYRYFNLNTGTASVQGALPSEFNFPGFLTPTTGPVKGYLLVSESYGSLTNVSNLLVGPNSGSTSKVGNTSIGVWNGVAPYAQVDNILPGNVLIADTNDPNIGLLDTRGSFGSFNKNPFDTTAPPYARVNTDILGIDISNTLSPNQNSLYTKVYYGGINSGVVSSQSVQVNVDGADFRNISKTVDKSYAGPGTTLTYTITMSNKGNVNSSNTILIDTIPIATVFAPGSVIINGVTSINANPHNGIALGTINVNQATTISYKVTVAPTIPYPVSIANTAEVKYSFVPGTGANPVDSIDESNTALTTLNIASLLSTKSVNKTNSFPGDVLTYTIPITNLGTTVANSIVFIDTIPSNVTIVPNSFKQDGVVIATLPNPPGVTLNNIQPNKTSTITYQVTISTIPSSNSIQNNATVGYQYTIDPTSGVNVNTVTSTNTVLTTINYADLSDIKKLVDLDFTSLNTTINYTVAFTNTGNLNAQNVILVDTIPSGTTFINGSVNIDGVTSINANPTLPGINLGTINVNQRTTITFSVLTTPTTPYPSAFTNDAQVSYNYSLGTLTSSTIQAISNSVVTTLSSAILSASKSVDKTLVNFGDVLTYKIPISNTGTAITNSIILIDTIPLGLTFVANSLTQDGVVIQGSPAPPGVVLNNIEPGMTSTVSFQGTVTSRPPSDLIKNEANIGYSYVVDPNAISTFAITVTTSVNASTNTVTSYLQLADLSNINKSVSSNFADLGTTITYTVAFTNTGNLTANNVILIDTVPAGTTFVSGSVYINGVNSPSANPASPGINLGTLNPNATSTVSFSVVVSPSAPYPNLLSNVSQATYNYQTTSGGLAHTQATSNVVITDLNTAVLSATKTVDKASVNIGDILIFTVSVNNIGTTTAKDVYFIDSISSSLAIVPNSFKVDGLEVAGSLVSPGIYLGDIAPHSSKLITFKAKVAKPSSSGEITNAATFNYTYIVDPSKPVVSGSKKSNTVTSSINMANISNLRKRVDKTNAMIDDVLIYTISMTNTGTIDATNIFLKDIISRGASFVPGSVAIDGVAQPNANPISAGMNIGTLLPNQSTIITFKVNVIAILPPPCEIINTAKIEYVYVSGSSKISARSNSNTISTELASPQIPYRGKYCED